MASLGVSYAQAAKGLPPSSNVSSNPASSASSDHGAKDAPIASETLNPQPKLARSPPKADKETSTISKSAQSSRFSEEDASQHTKPPTQLHDATAEDTKAAPTQKSPQDGELSAAKNTTNTAVATAGVEEQANQRQGSPDATDVQEKTKDADDDWEKVSIPSSTIEKEFKAAPIPAVNFWAQRSQTLQAKLKEQAAQRHTAPAAPQSRPRPSPTVSEDSRTKASRREHTKAETGNTPAARVTSNGRVPREPPNSDISPKSGPQTSEGSVLQQPLPVDVESWPTPETAIVDAGRRSSTREQTDRAEVTDAKPPTRKKEWTAMPFVPSVKFETQIPGAARRGGRPANSRGGGRGGMAVSGERSTEKGEPGSMAPPPLPKTTSDQDRGRKGNAARSTRASSVPDGAQRAGDSDDQQRLTSMPSSNHNEAISDTVGTGTQTPSTQDPSRSSSRQPAQSASAKSQKPDFDSNPFQISEVTQSPTRQLQQSDRPKGSNGDTRGANDSGEKPQSKEWQDKRSGNAQKGENWRPRGERSERGRGSYRGRGGHAGYNNPSFTSPLPQNGFDANKQGGQPDLRTRQQSQTFGSPFNSARSNPRSQSIPVHMLQGSGFYQPGPGFPQTLPPIQTDMGYGGYGQMPTGMPGGIMSAMPYNEQLNGFALMSMVVTQLEYYFSLDNLCKDMYLRKNMDSQGFVLLRVIAEFRRIKALLGDSSMSYGQLRDVAQQVRNIEYVVGEDGEDRLRSRENWKDFVLPMEERFPQAQTEGSKIKSSHPRHQTGVMADFQMSNGLRSAPPNVNGFHDAYPNPALLHYQQGPVHEPESAEQWASRVDNVRPEDDRRPSVTSPPLSKIQSPSQESRIAYGSLTNGHRDSMSSNATGLAHKESTFPDESVAALKVVVRDPDYQGNGDDASATEPVPTRVSGLRGGAGSPEQFERIRALQFGQSASAVKNDEPLYFTQGEGPPPHLVKPGYIWEEYLSLRDLALNQRAQNHFDGASVPLYPLWSEFLSTPNQFNVGMYEDFKTWALEDNEKGNDNGKKYLVKFYDAMLTGRTPMTERIANDIIDIARKESGANRPIWLKLRAAWRNGATNMKTRKRLSDLLSQEEQTELDRGK